MLKTRVLVFLVVLSAVTAAACTPVPAPGDDPTPASTPAPTLTLDHVVSMGDSYSSGEGLAPYGWNSNAANNRCHRSPRAYGPLLAAAGGARDFSFVACSGALTDDLFSPNYRGFVDAETGATEGPQLDVLSDTTRLVTLTIGGNDVGLADLLPDCLVALVGVLPVYGNPACAFDPSVSAVATTRLRALAGQGVGTTPQGIPIHSIRSVIDAVHERAPGARILIAGYPQLVGNLGALNECGVGGVTVSNVPVFSTANADLILTGLNALFINQIGAHLNDIIRHAATTAAEGGIPVSYVDPTTTFDGHGQCDRFTPWIDGVSGTVDAATVKVRIDRESFHPTATGQKSGYKFAFLAALATP